jgi:uncharacterized protein (DUF1810 family)
MHPVPEDLQRFLEAQRTVYTTALAEVRDGRKRTHWMWYIFPQLAGLGTSEMAQKYAIRDLAEAERYLAHPVLGPRLLEITTAVMSLEGRTAHAIFGSPDDWKLRSCCTLFALVSPPGSVFEQLLDSYFDGQRDPATLRLLS